MENVGSQSDGSVRDVELAGCDGINGRHVFDGESWSVGVGGLRSAVGEDVGIAVSDKNICRDMFAMENPGRLELVVYGV